MLVLVVTLICVTLDLDLFHYRWIFWWQLNQMKPLNPCFKSPRWSERRSRSEDTELLDLPCFRSGSKQGGSRSKGGSRSSISPDWNIRVLMLISVNSFLFMTTGSGFFSAAMYFPFLVLHLPLQDQKFDMFWHQWPICIPLLFYTISDLENKGKHG